MTYTVATCGRGRNVTWHQGAKEKEGEPSARDEVSAITIEGGATLEISREGAMSELRTAQTNGASFFHYAKTASSEMGLAYRNIVTPNGVEGKVVPATGADVPYFYVRDHLGSTRMVLEKTGQPAEATAYYCVSIRQSHIDFSGGIRVIFLLDP